SPREIDARVVWVRGEAIVLAGGQATRFRIGDRVTIVDRGRALATAEVAGLTSDGIAVAHLTGGSLAKIRRLDRLRVQAVSAPLRSIAMLRVGCPSIGRPCLAFPCPAPAPDLSPLASYRTEALANGVFRMVRATAGGSEPPWPDTVMVR